LLEAVYFRLLLSRDVGESVYQLKSDISIDNITMRELDKLLESERSMFHAWKIEGNQKQIIASESDLRIIEKAIADTQSGILQRVAILRGYNEEANFIDDVVRHLYNKFGNFDEAVAWFDHHTISIFSDPSSNLDEVRQRFLLINSSVATEL
jgi:hypothetical protein